MDTSIKMSDTARNYLNSFFEIVDSRSLRRDSINLKKIKKIIFDQFKNAQRIADCYPAIVLALKEVNDKHSVFMPYDQVKVWQGDTDEHSSFPFGYGQLLENNIGYISVPTFYSGSPRKMQLFADSLQRQVETIDAHRVNGWIIDVRNNAGGNCWPMLAGIGPLLGEGVCGYFAGRDGLGPMWKYEKGIIYEGTKEMVRVPNPYDIKQKFTRVAVLTGPLTASSGEVVVVSLIGRSHTRSFGEPTCGLSTGNQDFKLSDGSMLFLTTSVYMDRNKRKYGSKIVPDEVVPFSKNHFPEDQDPVVKRAIEWLVKNK
jgi:C-terminal processing protease CtpA/Prc